MTKQDNKAIDIATALAEYETLSNAIDRLTMSFKADVAPLTARLAALEETVRSFMADNKVEHVSPEGVGFEAVINKQNVLNIIDWPKFYAYIKREDAFDLLNKKAKTTAIKARLELEGEEGDNIRKEFLKFVKPETIRKLNIKRKGKK